MLPQYVLKINEYMVKYNVSYNKAKYLIMKENMDEYIKALQASGDQAPDGSVVLGG